MAQSASANLAPPGLKTDSPAGASGDTALKAIAHLQKVAESLAAESTRLGVEQQAAAPEIKVAADKPAAAAAPTKAATALRLPELPPLAVLGKAAAAVALFAAVSASAYLGLHDRSAKRAAETAKVEAPKISPESAAIQALQHKVAELTRETHRLRASLEKQASELRSAQRQVSEIGSGQARAASAASAASAAAQTAAAAAAQVSAKLDKAEKDASARFEQQTARVERLERLAADPVVTSSIPKGKTAGATPSPVGRTLGTPTPSMGPNEFVLRSVRNGVAVVQTRRGLIEVGPGDVIPGVGRVQRIARVDGRWVVETRDGYIDSD